MRKVFRWSMGIVVLGAVVALIVYAMLPRPVPVDAAVVVVAPMQMTVDEEGKTRIRERYVVSSPLTGRLRRIALDPGDRVEAHQTVLAIVEPTDPALLDARAIAEASARERAADASVSLAGSTLERARAQFEFAKNELARMTAAFSSGAANERELDAAKTLHRTRDEDVHAAQFGLEIARYELEVARSALLHAQGDSDADASVLMSLYSPIDGSVLRVFQESIAVVTPGTPLIEVGDPADLEVVIDVLSTDAVRVRGGDCVIFDHWGGDAPLVGVVRLVEPSAETKISALGIEEQRVNVIADLVTPRAERPTLGDGFRVEASIVVWDEAEVLQIPTSAAFRDGARWAVFVIENGRVALRNIEIGRHNGQLTQIVQGLSEGDHVVLHPSDRLEAGARVIER